MRNVVLALATVVALAPAAALARTPETQNQQPARVGGTLQAPERIKYVPPVYPADAKAARVSGIVIAEAVVGADGSVSDVKVLKSVPMLDQAAVDAVRQWAYRPTLLNGVAVPVIMTVTVKFSLDDNANAPAPAMTLQGTVSIAPVTSGPPPQWNGVTALRIGGGVAAPERVKYVPPVFPDDARQARVSGIVIVEALVDETGAVVQAKVLKSVALLDTAALDAVRQWKYTPTLVNGVAVPVVMTVTVNFTLQ